MTNELKQAVDRDEADLRWRFEMVFALGVGVGLVGGFAAGVIFLLALYGRCT